MTDAVRFHVDVFERLVEDRFGSFDALRQAWVDGADADADDDLAETTLRAWLAGRLPNRGHLFRLARIFDVDPLVLVAVDAGSLVFVMDSLRGRSFKAHRPFQSACPIYSICCSRPRTGPIHRVWMRGRALGPLG